MIRLLGTAALTALLMASVAGAAETTAATNAPKYEPAPMPNEDLYAPLQPADPDPRISPTVFRPSRQFRGDGYSAGSSSQGYQERHMLPAAGVNLSVPLK